MSASESKPARVYQYEEIARQIRLQIRRGSYRHDGRIPSERALSKQFSVQRGTVRQALELLEKEGSICTDAKRGSFVSPPKPDLQRNVLLLSLPERSKILSGEIESGFVEAANAAGFQVKRIDAISASHSYADRLPVPEELPQDLAAIAFWPQAPTPIDNLFRLNEILPVVLLDRRLLGLSVDCVRFDDIDGARQVTEHLIQQGHQRIGFLADEVFAETVQNRWLGYAQAMEACGLVIDPRISLFFHGLHEPLFTMAISEILSWKKEAPTAIVCTNDLVAFGLLRVLRDRGIRVPEDLVVTGFSNVMTEYLDAAELTSVQQSFSDLGRIAAEILIERVHQSREERLRAPKDVSIPMQLVVRKSSDFQT